MAGLRPRQAYKSKTAAGRDAADRAAKAAAGYQKVSYNMIKISSDPLLPTMTVEELKAVGPYKQHTPKEKEEKEGLWRASDGRPARPAELAPQARSS